MAFAECFLPAQCHYHFNLSTRLQSKLEGQNLQSNNMAVKVKQQRHFQEQLEAEAVH